MILSCETTPKKKQAFSCENLYFNLPLAIIQLSSDDTFNNMEYDPGLETLLSLDGTEYTEENGYWAKIEAKKVTVTPERPHGISYCLTFHDNFNQRIFGIDNAHSIKPEKKGRYKARIIEYDHVHKSLKGKAVPYEFTSAAQLLEDFFNEVNKIMLNLNN